MAVESRALASTVHIANPPLPGTAPLHSLCIRSSVRASDMTTSYEHHTAKGASPASYELEHRSAKGSPPHEGGLRPSDRDRDDLQVRGVVPVFNRNFRAPGSIAYTVNSIISAEYFIGSLAYLLYNGGRALLTFGLPANLPGMICLYWSLGEMMSM